MSDRDRKTSDASDEQGAGPPAHEQRSGPGAGLRRTLIWRLRKPMIGLGLLGAAAPMASARRQAQDPGQPRVRRAPGTDTSQSQAAGPDIEESLARRLGETRAAAREAERADTIQTAVERHGISEALATEIYDAAAEAGIEPEVAYGLVRTESGFRQDAVSPVGARGLTQLLPRTARWLEPGTSTNELFDSRTNLRLGFQYLRQLLDKYSGDLRLALTAYNRGPGTVDRVLRSGGDPDNGYAGRVLGG